MESLMEKSRPKGWEAALSHRNRLLEYDRTRYSGHNCLIKYLHFVLILVTKLVMK